MAILPFQRFRSLIAGVEKEALFDAVKPQLQDYADHHYPQKTRGDAYQAIFASANEDSGGPSEPLNIDYENNIVRRMGKGRSGRGKDYGTSRIHAERLYYFFLFSDERGDPTYGERISEALFGENFYVRFQEPLRAMGIPRPKHLPPLRHVRLGPVTLSHGYDENLIPLSLQEPEDELFLRDGLPDIFWALNWRSRLCGLHGRTAEFEELQSWALESGTPQASTMLISGPGGVGKTRLAADVVDRLVRRHSWAGGFLPWGTTSTDLLDGNGAGVALIIDDPEERTEDIKQILRAASNDTRYDRPVRLILLSRENAKAWKRILNEPGPSGMHEIGLGTHPHLNGEDARHIVEDIAETYPHNIGRPKPRIAGVEEWLAGNDAHRLPIMIVAAAIHAVLDPEHAFALAGRDILKTLADIELKRVRSYSQRDLGTAYALEKLLGLSLLTPSGLSKEAVHRLGQNGICEGRNGNSLLESVQATPFWRGKSGARPSHLIRMEPDRPAAAFLLQALQLDDPPPGLHDWLAPVIEETGHGIGEIIGRIGLDLAFIDDEASRSMEEIAIAAIRHHPDLSARFEQAEFRRESGFSVRFAAAVCDVLLMRQSDLERRVRLLSRKSNLLSTLGEHRAALAAIDEAIAVLRGLPEADSVAAGARLAALHNNRSLRLATLGENERALAAAEEAVEMQRELARESPGKFSRPLAHALNNLSLRLADRGSNQHAIEPIMQAVDIHRELAKDRSMENRAGLAEALNNLANRFSIVKRHDEAIEIVQEGLAIFQELAAERPDIYQADLAGAYGNLANRLAGRERYQEALEANTKALAIRRELAAARPTVFGPRLAESLSNQANRLYQLGEYQEALPFAEEAIETLGPLFLQEPSSHSRVMRIVCRVHAKICEQLGIEAEHRFLEPILEKFQQH